MDIASYRRIVERLVPQIHVGTCTPILEGWDYQALEINGEYIFRFPRRPDVERQMEKEIMLLPNLADTLPVAVPHFEFICDDDEHRGKWFVGYRKITGIQLTKDTLQTERSAQVIQNLARFLTQLHRFPVQEAARLKVPGGSTAQWRQEYQDFYDWTREHVFPLSEPRIRTDIATLWGAFLNDGANFRFRPALVHADLGAEHILYDPDERNITGVIDWGDATIGDPALDFVGLLQEHGRDSTERVLVEYKGEVDETFWQRIAFYSELGAVHEIRFGLLTGPEAYVRRGLERLREKFSEQHQEWGD